MRPSATSEWGLQLLADGGALLRKEKKRQRIKATGKKKGKKKATNKGYWRTEERYLFTHIHIPANSLLV
jgi:hypothetical protein